MTRTHLAALLGAVVVGASLLAAPAVAAGSPALRPSTPLRSHGTVQARVAATAVRVEREGVRRQVRLGVGRSGHKEPGEATQSVPAPLVGTIPLKIIRQWPGLAETADGLAVEPPDPWVAASGAHVVQSTNAAIRMYGRTGTELLTVPTWALFALTPDEVGSDPRIIWDQAHGRWVGVLLSRIEAGGLLVYGALNIVISDTADPTGSWQVRSIGYYDPADVDPSDGTDATLPDYPAIASSSDKLVLTANEYDHHDAYLGSSVLVLRWSDLLAGGATSTLVWTQPDSSLFAIRPAIVQSPSSDVHLVAEGLAASDYRYARLAGLSVAEPAWTSLAGVVAPFCLTDDPSQPGVPATIVDAVDDRPTDAVWRSNVLAVVSTCGSGGDDYARVVQLDTSTATPTLRRDDLVGPGAGTDAYMGGIGFSGDGSLYLGYTQSSATENPGAYATVFRGGAWAEPVVVAPGRASYGGTRWGDYLGVAPDPAGTAAVWVANQFAEADGTWSTSVARVAVDTAAPILGAPAQTLVRGSTLGSSRVQVKVGWTATDDGTGVARSVLEYNQPGSPGMAPAGLFTGTSTVRSHLFRSSSSTVDDSYQYQVSAVDAYGNSARPAVGLDLTAVAYQQSSGVTYAGTWGSQSGSAYSGGSVRYSSRAGSAAQFRASGRSFAFVTTRASTRGKAKIYVDGSYKGILTMRSTSTGYRNLAYVVSFAAQGTHTIRVVVYSGRVDIDAFVVLR